MFPGRKGVLLRLPMVGGRSSGPEWTKGDVHEAFDVDWTLASERGGGSRGCLDVPPDVAEGSGPRVGGRGSGPGPQGELLLGAHRPDRRDGSAGEGGGEGLWRGAVGGGGSHLRRQSRRLRRRGAWLPEVPGQRSSPPLSRA